MSEKLNVCLLNDAFPPEIDGVANAVVNYASIINGSLGHAAVVTPAHPLASDGDFSFPVLRYPSIDLTRKVGYYAGIPFSPELLEKLSEKRFDIIHTHCPITSTMLARMLRDRIDAPVVFTYHTKFDIDIANAVKGKLLQEGAEKILVENISACDEVWTVSRGAGENLRSLGYEGEWRVMPNGVDFPRGIVSHELIEHVTSGFDLPEDVPVFLFVGRMMWYKGIRIILDALKMLCEKGVDFRMVFIGGGGDKDEITAYTEKLGLTGRVLFSKPIRDRDMIRTWYCRADLFLFPSTFDTNGLVVREAAACALASVLVKGSCAAEDVTDGVSGFLIDENAESMAAKLLELCAAPEAAARVGEGAQRHIYMSWEDAVKRAYSRYFDVSDNYRCGLYPSHGRFSDELFGMMSDGLTGYSRAKQQKLETLAEIKKRYDRLREDGGELADSAYSMAGRGEHNADCLDELPEDFGEFISELQEGRELLLGIGENAKQKVFEYFSELGERFERFR